MTPLAAWLDSQGLGAHATLFERQDIDLDLLPTLTEDDLAQLGLSMGQRKRLLLAIASLRTPPAAAGGSAAARAPERRRLTVMFCDVAGSTALSERLDPEDLRSLMLDYQQRCREIIGRHDGHVAQYLGDGLMVYFGWPRAHEDDAARAVSAALDITRAVKTIAAPQPLQVRIGIATGPVVVGATGDGDASVPKAAVGATPNVAARLQSLAQPDQIVIAANTRRLLGELYTYADLGEQTLHGLSSPEHAWRVLGPQAAASRFDAMRGGQAFTPIIGRAAEVNLLRERWQRAHGGSGQAVLVRGEPGIGKSRLLHALRDHIAGTPHRLVRFDCAAHFRNSALYPVTQMLVRDAHIAADGGAEARLAKLRALLASADCVSDEAAALLSALLANPLEGMMPALDMTPQLQRQQTYAALDALIGGLAKRSPLLVVLEDAHWADPSTLEFVGRLIERVNGWRALVVVTFRPSFEPPWPSNAHTISLSLARLGADDAMRLVREVADHKALPAVLMEQIAAKTDGVPLFVEELTKTLLEAGILRDDGERYVLTGSHLQIDVPGTLHDSLMERLDHLGAAKGVAQTCAAIGREFSFDFLHAVSPGAEAPLRAALAELRAAGLIVDVPAAEGESYAFKHALVQEVAYSTLLRADRQRLHARIAEVIEARSPETAALHPELLAHHHAEAGHKARAIGFASAASLAALQRSSYVETIAHARQALGWLDAIADADERNRTELSLNGLITPAMMVHYGYASEELERVTQRSLQLIDAVGDAPAVFPTLWALKVYHHVRSNRVQARALAQRFVDMAERTGDSGQLVAGLPLLAQCLWIEGDYAGARSLLERGLALYDTEAHRAHALLYGIDSSAYCLMTLSQVQWGQGDAAAALASAQRAVEHARDLKHANTVGLALLYLMMVHQQRDERGRVAELGQETLDFCERYGVATPSSYARLIHNWAVGDVDGSLRIIAVHEAIKAVLGLTYYRALIAETAAAAGRHDEALALVDTCLKQAEEQGEHYHVPELHRLRGRILLLRDPADLAGAEARFEQALAVARAQSAPMHELRAGIELHRIWRMRGLHAQAADLLAGAIGRIPQAARADTAARIEKLMAA